MPRPYRRLGRDAPTPDPANLCPLLQQDQNTPIIGTKMPQSFARFSGPGPSHHTRSWAGFIIITFGFRFSVHTRILGAHDLGINVGRVDFKLASRAMSAPADKTGGFSKLAGGNNPIDAPAALLWFTSWILELEGRRTDVFRLQTVLRLYRPLHRTALLVRQPCARQFFGNCPIRVDSRFCRAHPYTDKSRRCDSHSTLEGRTELGRPFERRSPRSVRNRS